MYTVSTMSRFYLIIIQITGVFNIFIVFIMADFINCIILLQFFYLLWIFRSDGIFGKKFQLRILVSIIVWYIENK